MELFMEKVQVCLVSDQPIPNLTTIYQFRPDKVILLYTKDKRQEKVRLELVLFERKYRYESVEIKAYDLDNVITVCDKILQNNSNADVSLNITGGTKIGTVGTFQAFYSAGLPIFYVNTRDGIILQISPMEQQLPISVRINVKDYLAAYGFKVENHLNDDKIILARREVTDALRNLAIRSEWVIGRLNGAFPPDAEKSCYPLTIDNLPPDLISIAPLLEKHSLAQVSGPASLSIPNVDAAKYLQGGWFEELVYFAAKGAGADEVKLNVTGVWDSTGRAMPKNEFDVMIGKGTRLFYISCKTANPDRQSGLGGEGVGKEYLYELDSLGDRALGLFGKKLLATARTVGNDYLKKRASVMNIIILDKNDLPNLKGKIQQCLNT